MLLVKIFFLIKKDNYFSNKQEEKVNVICTVTNKEEVEIINEKVLEIKEIEGPKIFSTKERLKNSNMLSKTPISNLFKNNQQN